jgi:hypothetical protein
MVGHVSLISYAVLGWEVRNLADVQQEAENCTVIGDSKDEQCDTK